MENNINRALGFKIKDMIMTQAPTFLIDHMAHHDEFLAATTNGDFVGGYSFYIAGKCWVGKVKVWKILQNHEDYVIEFCRCPKNAEGVNEWKIDHQRGARSPRELIEALKMIDNKLFEVPGGIQKKRSKFNHFTRVSKKSI
jgi:hypothetical protein